MTLGTREIEALKKQLNAIQMPRAPEDQEMFPETPYGFPDDWDWETSELGPNGEKKPNGAVGWTPHGSPYYGTNNNITEWWAGLGNRMTRETTMSWSDHMEKTAESWDQTKASFSEGEIGDGLLGLLSTTGAFVGGLGDIGAEGSGEQASFFAYASRGLGELISGVGTGLGEVAQFAERTVFGGRAALEEIAESSGIPDIEIFRAVPENAPDPKTFLEKTGRFMGQVWDAINPIDLAYDVFRATQSPIANKGDVLEKHFQSARIAYSGWMKEGLIAEYQSRWEAGESAFLLEQELQDPIVEMVGEMIFDPLNLIAFLGKGGKNAKKAYGSYAEYKANLLSEAPEIATYLDKVDDLTEWQKNQGFVKAVAETVKRVGTKADKWATDINFSGLTQTSKRIKAERIVGEFTGWLMNSARRGGEFNIDDSLEALSAVVKLSSTSADEVAEGITMLGSFDTLPTGPLFSESGIRTSIMLRSLLEDADGVIDGAKFMDKLREGEKLEDVLELMEGKVQKAVNKAIPTLAERAKAGENLGIRGDLIRVVEKVAESKPVRTINSFFAHVYMGMNPGYAARNAITNNLHIFTDAGFGAFTMKGSLFDLAPLENFVNDFYGHLPKAFNSGIGAAGKQEDLGWFGKASGYFLRAGQKGEQKSSMRLFSHATDQIMGQMLQPGRVLPDTAPLLKAGLDQVTANHLQDLIIRNNGNVNRAADLFRAEISTGKLDLFKAGGWIKPQTQKRLKSYGLWPQVEEMIAKSWDNGDDAIRHLNEEIYGKLDELHAMAVKERVHIPNTESVIDELAAFDKMSDHPSPIKQNVESMAGANKYTEKMYRHVTDELDRVARGKGIDLNAVLDEVPHVKDTISGEYKKMIDTDNSVFTDRWVRKTEEIRGSNMSSKQLKELWQREGMYGIPPDDLTPQSFIDHFWNDYFPQNRRIYWKASRDKTVNDSLEYMRAVTGQEGVGWAQGDLSRYLDDAEKARIDAEAWDEFIPGFKPSTKTSAEKEVDLAARRWWEEPVPTQLPQINEEKKAQDILTMKEDFSDLIKKTKAARAKKAEQTAETAKTAEQATETIADIAAPKKSTFRNDSAELMIIEIKAGNGPTEMTPALENMFRQHGFTQDEIDLKPLDELIDEIQGMKRASLEKITPKIDEAARDKEIAEYLQKTGDEKLINLFELRQARKPLPADFGEVVTSPARMMTEGKTGLDGIRRELVEGIQNNFGKEQHILPNPGAEKELTKWVTEAEKRSNEMKFLANEVATEFRHFGLVDYNARRNFDTVLGLIYPYHFWYSRTYPNWAKRVVRQPHILAGYNRYKTALAKIHAGAPDWWKYNINTNELFGLDSKNPLYFNLEQTLNPMNGLTGVDFDDPHKTTGWATQMLQDMNRFGPNTHTMFSLATALSLHYKGKDEAAARWGGRLFPQTQTLMSVDALFGDDPIKDWDPFVQFFADGVSPYVRNRAGRAGATMQMEGIYSPEQIQEGMFSQSGEVWDAAVERAQSERAPGQLASFFMGAGFKARSIGDIQTDQMYNEFFRLMDSRSELSPAEFKNEMDSISKKYKFMDSVLISRKGGIERDTAFAYAVLRRIPPGLSSEVYEMVGLDRRIVSKFYDDKGAMEEWAKSDHDRFMAAIVDVSAVLKIPGVGTQAEWTQARNELSDLKEEAARRFGEDIHEKIDVFFGLYGATKEKAYAFLEQHPEVEDAMDLMEWVKMSLPGSLLTTYYASFKDINDYYLGVMYDAAEKKFGEDIFDLQNLFFAIPSSEQKKFKRENPQLEAYWKWSRIEKDKINRHVISVGSMLKDIKPAEIREDADLSSFGAQDLAAGILEPVDPLMNVSITEWQGMIGKFALQYIVDNLSGNRTIPSTGNNLLDREAQNLGISRNQLIQYVGLAIQRESQLVLPSQ